MSATLYGYVDTSLPGHRQVEIGGTTYTIAPGYYRGDALVTALDTAIGAASWDASRLASGVVRINDATATGAAVSWPDRLGAILGMGREAGTSEPGTPRTVTGAEVPQVAIPLAGAQWMTVNVEREVELARARSGRAHGYLWGGVRVWAWRITMTAASLRALRAGWCLAGPVTIEGAETDPMGSAVPTGALTGRVMDLRDARWLGPDGVCQYAEATLVLATEVTA